MERVELDAKELGFTHFIDTTIIVATHIAQAVIFGVIAFAAGTGWWPALAMVVAIGIVIGLLLHRHANFWALQVSQDLILAITGVFLVLVT